VLVRHGESLGNLADRAARQSGAARLDLQDRDADVPLSDTGRDRADALGRHLRDLGATAKPTAVVSSPYRRSADTAEQALATAGLAASADA
jgi:broad specificity phosphatase PhoE